MTALAIELQRITPAILALEPQRATNGLGIAAQTLSYLIANTVTAFHQSLGDLGLRNL